MRLIHLVALVLLAGSAVAKPLHPNAHHKRQSADSLVLGITQTSIGAPTTTTTDSIATCTALYTPEDNETCGETADRFDIWLWEDESELATESTECEDVLHQYRICRTDPLIASTSMASTSVTANASSTASDGGVVATITLTHINGTGNATITLSNSAAAATATVLAVYGNGTSNTSAVSTNASFPCNVIASSNGTVSLSNGTSATNASSLLANSSSLTLTLLETRTLSYLRTLNYAQGTANATSLKTIMVTHTDADIVRVAAVATGAASKSTLSSTSNASSIVLNPPVPGDAVKYLQLGERDETGPYAVIDPNGGSPQHPGRPDGPGAPNAFQGISIVDAEPTDALSAPEGSIESTAAFLATPQPTIPSVAPSPSHFPTPLDTLSTSSLVLTISEATPLNELTASAMFEANTSAVVFGPSVGSPDTPAAIPAAITTSSSASAPLVTPLASESAAEATESRSSSAQFDLGFYTWKPTGSIDALTPSAYSYQQQLGLTSSLSTGFSSVSSTFQTLLAGTITSSLTSEILLATTTTSTLETSTTTSSLAFATASYKSYHGSGSSSDGWPEQSSWVDFDIMFEANQPQMKASCAQWGVPDNTDDEISQLKAAVLAASEESKIDARFILAIIMQESTGCVRVITTQHSHFNPGLMQSHDGTGSCNTNKAANGIPGVANAGTVQSPCPESMITQMIRDGTMGTPSGDGLQQLFQEQQRQQMRRRLKLKRQNGSSTSVSNGTSHGNITPEAGVETYYRVAKLYNGGSIAASGMLEDGCCTRSYASDIANRLTGWTTSERTFT